MTTIRTTTSVLEAIDDYFASRGKITGTGGISIFGGNSAKDYYKRIRSWHSCLEVLSQATNENKAATLLAIRTQEHLYGKKHYATLLKNLADLLANQDYDDSQFIENVNKRLACYEAWSEFRTHLHEYSYHSIVAARIPADAQQYSERSTTIASRAMFLALKQYDAARAQLIMLTPATQVPSVDEMIEIEVINFSSCTERPGGKTELIAGIQAKYKAVTLPTNQATTASYGTMS